jgi:hypothetical protein
MSHEVTISQRMHERAQKAGPDTMRERDLGPS